MDLADVPETKRAEEVNGTMEVDDETKPPVEATPPTVSSPLVVVIPSPSDVPAPIPERSPSHGPPSPTTSSLAVDNHHPSPDPMSPSSSSAPIRKTSFADYLKRRKADTAMLKALQHERDRGDGGDSGGALSLILGERGREKLRESLPPMDTRAESIVTDLEPAEGMSF